MAQTPGTGMKILAIAGGVALLIVAWRFPVPLVVVKSTTLLSMVAVLLGMLVGWRDAVIITTLYILAVLLGLPQAIWGGHSGMQPFLTIPTNGLNLGLVAAAFVAAKLAGSGSHSGFARLALAALLGHFAYLACGVLWLWLLDFAPPAAAAQAVVKSQIIPVLVKSAAAFVIAMGAGRVIKR